MKRLKLFLFFLLLSLNLTACKKDANSSTAVPEELTEYRIKEDTLPSINVVLGEERLLTEVQYINTNTWEEDQKESIRVRVSEEESSLLVEESSLTESKSLAVESRVASRNSAAAVRSESRVAASEAMDVQTAEAPLDKKAKKAEEKAFNKVAAAEEKAIRKSEAAEEKAILKSEAAEEKERAKIQKAEAKGRGKISASLAKESEAASKVQAGIDKESLKESEKVSKAEAKVREKEEKESLKAAEKARKEIEKLAKKRGETLPAETSEVESAEEALEETLEEALAEEDVTPQVIYSYRNLTDANLDARAYINYLINQGGFLPQWETYDESPAGYASLVGDSVEEGWNLQVDIDYTMKDYSIILSRSEKPPEPKTDSESKPDKEKPKNNSRQSAVEYLKEFTAEELLLEEGKPLEDYVLIASPGRVLEKGEEYYVVNVYHDLANRTKVIAGTYYVSVVSDEVMKYDLPEDLFTSISKSLGLDSEGSDRILPGEEFGGEIPTGLESKESQATGEEEAQETETDGEISESGTEASDIEASEASDIEASEASDIEASLPDDVVEESSAE